MNAFRKGLVEVSVLAALGLSATGGRLGYLLQPSLLLYGTAGVGGDDDAGFVYGLGLESQLTYGTTGRIEYLEYDGDDVGVIRAGLNFQIGR